MDLALLLSDLTVQLPAGMRLQRLAAQRGWSEKEVEAREKAQLPITEKVRRADAVLDNSGDEEGLARQIASLLRQWRLES